MDPLIESELERGAEWIFLPRPWLRVDERAVVRDEPIRIGGGMAPVCQFLWRTGQERVYVCGSVRRPGREPVWFGHWHQVVMDSDTRTLSSPVPRAS